MGLNDQVSSERVHIGFFGRRNAGKSSVVNAVTGQKLAVVSDILGTTTDPVKKAMELLPMGPVVVIDTPGIDDEGKLGALRVERTMQTLNITDVAVLVVDASLGLTKEDERLIEIFKDKKIRYILAFNKSDLLENKAATAVSSHENAVYVSAESGEGIHELKEMIARLSKGAENTKRIVADLLAPGDVVVLVVPIDSAAPKGRLILPQQQTIRDILEAGAIAVVSRDTELRQTLASLHKKPKLVITDSQAFRSVAKDTPSDILLTSFSILFARYKGSLPAAVKAARAMNELKDGDCVLISEGCTHHRQCDDIGSVKIPKWLSEFTGKQLNFAFTSGGEFPSDLSKFALIIHCGGCMLNEREMQHRVETAASENVPMLNYGIAIAHMNGILKRSLEPFPEMQGLL
ncbi:MAG: [FeFe] hydrogenase H-cluster maturation GTPase HydF [Acutalibacteraceae bacterium]